MPIKPLGDRVLIKPQEAATETAGGLILVQTAQEKPIFGTVLDVGPKVENVTEGETVVYRRYAGSEVQYEGETYVLMPVNDIIGVLE